jgi:hypothetical protein
VPPLSGPNSRGSPPSKRGQRCQKAVPLGQDALELDARSDFELCEDLAQVVRDGARAQMLSQAPIYPEEPKDLSIEPRSEIGAQPRPTSFHTPEEGGREAGSDRKADKAHDEGNGRRQSGSDRPAD